MKGMGRVYQIHSCLSILLLYTIFLIPFVSADIAVGTITHVYFQKDDLSYNGSVHYTVTCYGYGHDYISRDQPALEQPEFAPRAVYQYSAICDRPGCIIYEPYYRINSGGSSWLHLEWCDVSGVAGDRSFVISNFSNKPYTECTNLPEPYRMPGDYPEPDSRYYMTEEYYACNSLHRNISVNVTHRIFSSCNLTTDTGCFGELLPSGNPLRQDSQFLTTRNRTEMRPDQYIQYIETCNPATDPDCGGIVVNGKPLKTMYEFRPFYNRSYNRAEYPCITFLVLTNRSLVLPEEIEDSSPRPLIDNKVRDICESRWTIPSDNESIQEAPEQILTSYHPESPVGSLWCSLLRLLGRRCE